MKWRLSQIEFIKIAQANKQDREETYQQFLAFSKKTRLWTFLPGLNLTTSIRLLRTPANSILLMSCPPCLIPLKGLSKGGLNFTPRNYTLWVIRLWSLSFLSDLLGLLLGRSLTIACLICCGSFLFYREKKYGFCENTNSFRIPCS